MIEVTILNYLKTALNIPVRMEFPENADKLKKFIVLSKIDAGYTNHIKAATFLLECYAASLYDAAVLSDLAKTKMFDAVELDDVSGVRLGGEKPGNDTKTKRYKYELIINLYHY